jgi:hypothetical protein
VFLYFTNFISELPVIYISFSDGNEREENVREMKISDIISNWTANKNILEDGRLPECCAV